MTKTPLIEKLLYAAVVLLSLGLLWLFALLPRLSLNVRVVYQGF